MSPWVKPFDYTVEENEKGMNIVLVNKFTIYVGRLDEICGCSKENSNNLSNDKGPSFICSLQRFETKFRRYNAIRTHILS